RQTSLLTCLLVAECSVSAGLRALPWTPRATALAVTMAAIASHSAGCSDCPRTTRPVSAADTGLAVMKAPENLAGHRPRAGRAASSGRDGHRPRAGAARRSAAVVPGWLTRAQMPTGAYSRADRVAAAAGP